MIATILAALVLTPVVAEGSAAPAAVLRRALAEHNVSIVVWTDRSDIYRRGERVRVYFKAETDAYVTILRVDTDGRVRVLFPGRPWDDNYVRGGRRYEVRSPYGDRGRYAFTADDYPGQGYLFAVASIEPFAYHAFVSNGRWDYYQVGHRGRITGDPYVALTDLIDRLVPLGYDDYGYDIYPYDVEHRYEYPRFLCYDCHGYRAYPAWDPYRHWCATFRIVIYDDPYPIYPYTGRVYGPTRVVYRRPVRLEPRFVFEPRTTGTPYVTRAHRPADGRTGGQGETRGSGRVRTPAAEHPTPVREREPAGRVPAPRVQPPSSRSGAEPAAPEPRRRAPAETTPRRETSDDESWSRPQLERRQPREIDRVPVRDPSVQPVEPARRDERPEARRPTPDREPAARADSTRSAGPANPVRAVPGRRPAPQAGKTPDRRPAPEKKPEKDDKKKEKEKEKDKKP